MIKKFVVPICGLALGFATLGNLVMSYSSFARYTCGLVSLVILIIFTLRVFIDFDGVKKEIENPIGLSVLPTYSMAIVVLSTYLKPFIGNTSKIFWFFGLFLHFAFIIIFSKRYLIKFNIKTVFPSWFIVYVGFVVGSVTSPAMDFKNLGMILFLVGFIFYLVVLVFAIYRIAKIGEMPKPAIPTLSIMTAPIGLCTAGYLSAFDNPNEGFTFFLVAILTVSYIFSFINAAKLVFKEFFPSFSSFTFPLIISALAYKIFLSKNFIPQNIGLTLFINILIIISIIFTITVSLRYFNFIKQRK